MAEPQAAESSAGDPIPMRHARSVVGVLIEQRERWQRGERVQVEAFLQRHPELISNVDAVLDLVGNELLLRREAGETLVLNEYLERFPQWAEQVELQFEAETAAATLTGNPGESITNPAAPASYRMPLVPGFDILAELGRGGQSVVYKARQLSLNRLVALKMILSGSDANSEQRARFRTEAEAVARLKHPNIVQIYDIREQEGQLYFALEFVAGGTLTQKLAGTPQPPLQAAQLLATIAHAVHEAHMQGIVHRDLKPANILLATDGSPKITDFGLAKQLHSDADLTHTGNVMGTPSYMAPEQASGKNKQVGPTADVYALGAILYEMLTGRPPHLGASPWEVLQQVLLSDPVSPRRLQPNVPRDLETICLKCLQKEAQKRYPSALDLADDLEHFQKGEPIRARPIGRTARVWRWSRRNPKVASLLLVLLCVVIGSVAGLTTLWRQAEFQRDAAEDSFQDAFDAVGDYLTSVSENRLLNEPGFQPLRKDLLLKAQIYYEKFVRDRGADPNVRSALAKAYQQLGAISIELGDLNHGILYVDKAIAISESQIRQDPASDRYRVELALAQNLLGKIYLQHDRADKAKATFEEVLRVLEAKPGGGPLSAAGLKQKATAYANLGFVSLVLTGQLEQAATLYKQALEVMEQALQSEPDEPEHRRLQGLVLHNLSKAYEEMGKSEEAAKTAGRALEIRENLHQRFPTNLKYRLDLSLTCDLLAIHAKNVGENELAERLYLRSTDLLRQLHHENPAVGEFAVNFAQRCRNLSNLYFATKQTAKAEKVCQESVVLLEDLTHRYPDVPRYRNLLADSLQELGSAYRQMGQTSQAEEAYDNSLTLRLALQAEQPTVPEYRADLAAIYNNLGQLRLADGKMDRAEEAYQQARDIHEKLLENNPTTVRYLQDSASNLHDLGVLYQLAGKFDQSEAAFREALEVHQKLVDENPGIADYQVSARQHLHNSIKLGLARTIALSGNHVQAAAAASELAHVEDVSPRMYYDLARLHCLCASIALKDEQLAQVQRDKLAQMYSGQALDLLGKSDSYCKDPAVRQQLASEPDLGVLRGQSGFQKWIQDLDASARSEKKNP